MPDHAIAGRMDGLVIIGERTIEFEFTNDINPFIGQTQRPAYKQAQRLKNAQMRGILDAIGKKGKA